MTVEVDVLKDFARDARFKKKWLKTWERLGVTILKFPDWMQEIILEDVNTAIKNRIAIMEMINEHQKSRRK